MNPQNSPTSSWPAGGASSGDSAAESGGAMTDTKNKITQTARDAAAKVKAVASTTAAKARGEAERLATEKKETAANRIGGYSSAIHESARAFEEKDPNIAWFTHQAADKIQGVADYLRNSDLACVRGDCEGIARRNPALFFGGLFFAGLLLGNIVKASSTKLNRSGETPGGSDGPTGSLEAANTGDDFSAQQLTDAERSAAGI